MFSPCREFWSQRALAERARSLVTAGLAVQRDGGLALTSEPVLLLLDAVAVKAGTAGDRQRAIKSYRAKNEAWRQAREQAGEVDSPTWRKILHARMVVKMGQGDLAALVEHLHGDVDAAATYMVDLAVLAHSSDSESRASGMAMLAAGLRARAR